MPISALPTTPSSANPTTFAADMDAWLAALPTFRTEANAMAAAMTAVAAGGAVSLQYTFSTTITDADPGAGILRLDAATQNTATTIRADLLGNDTSDYSGVLALLDDSTSTPKGYITLRHATTATKWLVFAVASLASPSGYKNVTVTCVASSSANPFANADALLFDFTPTGDKGTTGDTGAGIAPQAVGFTATGGTTPKTLTVDDDVTASNIARRNAANNYTNAQNTARATVASAATTADIWGAAGNQIDWTGTVTCTGFPAAPQAGAERVLICAGAAPFTAGANMLIDGVASAATVTCAANDQVIVRAVSTTQFKLSRVKYDGTAQVGSASASVPVGAEMLWPTEIAPTGWLEENGASLLRAGTYADLYAVIGTTYGTADGTHFNLPDARGRFIRGWDHGAARDPDRASRTADATTGATMTAGDHVGTLQADAFKAHVHAAKTTLVSLQNGAYGAGVADGDSGSTGGNETRPINTNRMMIIKY